MSAPTSPAIEAGTWKIDTIHSHVGFSVKHMVVATFRGRFDEYEGSLTAGEDGAPRLEGKVKVDSLVVKDENLAGHLRSPDFFDADNYPEISFVSRSLDVSEAGEVEVEGDLTIKGNTHLVTGRGSLTGPHVDIAGNDKLGVELEAVIDRREFGLNWNAPAPQGRVRARERRQARGLARARQGGLGGHADPRTVRKPAPRVAQHAAAAGGRHAAARGRRAGAVRPARRDPAVQRGRRARAARLGRGAEARDRADRTRVLIATPEYNSSIPGVLKNALDWVSRPRSDTPLMSKPVAVIGASTSLFGAVWAQAETRKVLGATGARVVDRELPVPHADESLDADGLPLERGRARGAVGDAGRAARVCAQPARVAACS